MMLALLGGVGGARLAQGLAALSPPGALALVVNTGDDFQHYGLHISPDLDSVMYALAGCNDTQRGWGLRNETWHCMEALAQRGEEPWFQLGDQDLATHLLRTQFLRSGLSLTDATQALCRRFGLEHALIPMSEAPSATRIETSTGTLSFQDYFVRHQCRPTVQAVRHQGGAPSPAFLRALTHPDLSALIFCPSNPYLSIGPILSLDGITHALRQRKVPSVAVSPIVGGAAVKGPLARLMQDFGLPVSPVGIARHYDGLIDAMVIDHRDEHEREALEAMGLRCLVTDTLMTNPARQEQLARQVLNFASHLGHPL